ncbi:Loki-CTERM sorting domain-containing protein [Candidatus Harpocratesius sp.]
MKKKEISIVLIVSLFLSVAITTGQLALALSETRSVEIIKLDEMDKIQTDISMSSVEENDDNYKIENTDDDPNDDSDDEDTVDDSEGEEGENEEVDEEKDEDKDDIDDEYENENKREVKVEVFNNEIKLESSKESNNTQNKFEIKIKWDDGISLKLEFESEFENNSVESELEVNFKVAFKRIIEYLDNDGDKIFNKENDTTVQEYNIDTFKSPEYTPIVQNDSSILHYIKISTLDNIFTIHLFAAGEFMNVESTTITPTQVKIDLEINNFPFIENTSRLAVYTKLESEYEYEEENETEDEVYGFASQEAGISSMMNGFAAAFSWAEYALIDNVTQNVLVSSISKDDEDSTKEKMYFNYPQGINIYHDPKMGVKGLLTEPVIQNLPTGTNSDFLSSIPGYSAWVLLGVASMAVITLILKRKR